MNTYNSIINDTVSIQAQWENSTVNAFVFYKDKNTGVFVFHSNYQFLTWKEFFLWIISFFYLEDENGLQKVQ